jgi:hypothetical protein
MSILNELTEGEESDLEGQGMEAEAVAPPPTEAGVPFDMVHVEGSLPSFSNRVEGGRALPPNMARILEAREREREERRRRELEALERRLAVPDFQQVQLPLNQRVRPPPPINVNLPMINPPQAPPAPRALNNPNVGRRLNFDGQGKITLSALKAKAKAMGLKGFSTMKKAQLMEALKGGKRLYGKGDDEEMDELAEIMKNSMSVGEERPSAMPSMPIQKSAFKKVAKKVVAPVAPVQKRGVKRKMNTLPTIAESNEEGGGMGQSKSKVAPEPPAPKAKAKASESMMANDMMRRLEELHKTESVRHAEYNKLHNKLLAIKARRNKTLQPSERQKKAEMKDTAPRVKRSRVKQPTQVSEELATIEEASDEGAGMKMTLPMLKAKAKEMGLKGYSTMKKAQLMEALKGGSKKKGDDEAFEEMLKEAQYKMREGIFDRERPKAPLSIKAPKIAVGLDGTVASPKKGSPKKEATIATKTMSFDMPSASPKKGKGRRQRQRRAPKTRRLSAKDKSKR